MSSPQIRTRFAPSPTGALHLGNARTALLNWLHARAHGGDFVVRSEDTDIERTEESALASQLADLRWLGLAYDEGPEVGGPYAPYRQMERQAGYADLLARLQERGEAYPCFCTRDELQAARQRQLAAGQAPRYPGTCAALDETARKAHRDAGRSAVIRFRVSDGPDVRFTDLVHGQQRFRRRDIGDFVIARADGTPSFFFANAVDDALMQISHVLRGEDHLANTPRQILLLEALDLSVPEYGHFGLITDEEGQPLSKRGSAASIAGLRAAGWLPDAIVNHLARIGVGGLAESLLTLETLAKQFSLTRVSRGSAQHDPQRLMGWQRDALDHLDPDALVAWFRQHEPVMAQQLGEATLHAFAVALRPNVLLAREMADWIGHLLDPAMEPDAAADAAIRAAGPEFFTAAMVVTTPDPAADFRGWAKALGQATGCRGRALFQPVRAALTGRLAGPELASVIPELPEGLVQQRLARAAEQVR